jgi:hypothetical protein
MWSKRPESSGDVVEPSVNRIMSLSSMWPRQSPRIATCKFGSMQRFADQRRMKCFKLLREVRKFRRANKRPLGLYQWPGCFHSCSHIEPIPPRVRIRGEGNTQAPTFDARSRELCDHPVVRWQPELKHGTLRYVWQSAELPAV